MARQLKDSKNYEYIAASMLKDLNDNRISFSVLSAHLGSQTPSLTTAALRAALEENTSSIIPETDPLTLEDIKLPIEYSTKPYTMEHLVWLTHDLDPEIRAHYKNSFEDPEYLLHALPAEALARLEIAASGEAGDEMALCKHGVKCVLLKGTEEDKAKIAGLAERSNLIAEAFYSVSLENPSLIRHEFATSILSQHIKTQYENEITADTDLSDYAIYSLTEKLEEPLRKNIYQELLSKHEYRKAAMWVMKEKDPFYLESFLQAVLGNPKMNANLDWLWRREVPLQAEFEDALIYAPLSTGISCDVYYSAFTDVGAETALMLSAGLQSKTSLPYEFTSHRSAQYLRTFFSLDSSMHQMLENMFEHEQRRIIFAIMRLYENQLPYEEYAELPFQYVKQLCMALNDSYGEKIKADQAERQAWENGNFTGSSTDRLWFEWIDAKASRKPISESIYPQLMGLEPHRLKVVATDRYLPAALHETLLNSESLEVSYNAANSQREIPSNMAVDYLQGYLAKKENFHFDTALALYTRALRREIEASDDLNDALLQLVLTQQAEFADVLSVNSHSDREINFNIIKMKEEYRRTGKPNKVSFYAALHDKDSSSYSSGLLTDLYFTARETETSVVDMLSYINVLTIDGILEEKDMVKVFHDLVKYTEKLEPSEHSYFSDLIYSLYDLTSVAPNQDTASELLIQLFKSDYPHKAALAGEFRASKSKCNHEVATEILEAVKNLDPENEIWWKAVNSLATENLLPPKFYAEVFEEDNKFLRNGTLVRLIVNGELAPEQKEKAMRSLFNREKHLQSLIGSSFMNKEDADLEMRKYLLEMTGKPEVELMEQSRVYEALKNELQK